jgi:hypothetical protein
MIGLLALPGHRAMLRIKDDGPGTTDSGEIASTREKLGMRILQGLADQIHGTLNVGIHRGMEVTVDFPTLRSPTVEGRRRMRKNKKEGGKPVEETTVMAFLDSTHGPQRTSGVGIVRRLNLRWANPGNLDR